MLPENKEPTVCEQPTYTYTFLHTGSYPPVGDTVYLDVDNIVGYQLSSSNKNIIKIIRKRYLHTGTQSLYLVDEVHRHLYFYAPSLTEELKSWLIPLKFYGHSYYYPYKTEGVYLDVVFNSQEEYDLIFDSIPESLDYVE